MTADVLLKMRDTLVRRGPDDCGVYISRNNKVGLGHRRLSILDLTENGRQPMSNEDGRIWIVYNGEIYNFQGIKRQLQKRGHIFSSNADTEVIIHAYEEFGIDCLNIFEGMFAFAIYDEKKEKLFLARDRFGVKPVYYGFLNQNVFAFASELKAFHENPFFQKEINYGAIRDFFYYRYIPAPLSIWQGVNKLAQGHCLELDINEWKTVGQIKYYNFMEKVAVGGMSSLEEVDHLLVDAVRKRLISDVEVGTLLSGGVDSSCITAIAKKLHPEIKSFTIGFGFKQRDETPWARRIAEHLKVNHMVKYVNDFDESEIAGIANIYDEPFGDDSLFPTLLLARMAGEQVKVALSGDGGDEVFSGYTWYKRYLEGELKWAEEQGKLAEQSCFDYLYHELMEFGLSETFIEMALTKDALGKAKDGSNSIFCKYADNPYKGVRKLQYVDLNTFLVDQILVKVDRASMTNSLEVRTPFLDHHLVEAVFRLGQKEFPENSVDKPVLKKLMRGVLPKAILKRPKQGFGAPWHEWRFFAGDSICDFLTKGIAVDSGFINSDFLQRMIDGKGSALPAKSNLLLFIIFELWLKKWFQ